MGYKWYPRKMKKVIVLVGLVVAFLTTTAFITTERGIVHGPGDGKYSCEVYGAPGYIVTVQQRVITPDGDGNLYYNLKLNSRPDNRQGKGSIFVVVQLRNSAFDVIESKTAQFSGGLTGLSQSFNTKGKRGEAYYVTINSASCQ